MDLDAAVAELAALVDTLERDGDERALLLLQLVDAVHRPGIAALAAGRPDDPAARALTDMYLGSDEPELAAEEALDEVRPYIESHGGAVELLGVDEGVVRVRLEGACVGCAGSAMTLQRGIEEVLRERLPGFREVVAEEAQPAMSGFVLPMAPAGVAAELRRPIFVDVGAADEFGEGELRAIVAEGVGVLIARVGGELYALRNGCSVDGLPLEGGRLTAEGVLVCPWHNCAFEVRSGRRVDDEEGRITVVPVAVRDNLVKVAVNVA